MKKGRVMRKYKLKVNKKRYDNRINKLYFISCKIKKRDVFCNFFVLS